MIMYPGYIIWASESIIHAHIIWQKNSAVLPGKLMIPHIVDCLRKCCGGVLLYDGSVFWGSGEPPPATLRGNPTGHSPDNMPPEEWHVVPPTAGAFTPPKKSKFQLKKAS